MFDKFKDLYKLQKQAKELKKQLANTHIEAEIDGVVVIMTGEQEVVSITFPETETNTKKLAENTMKAFNKGVKKAQQIAAEIMKPLMGNMGGMGDMAAGGPETPKLN